MVVDKPKQSPDYKQEEKSTLAKWVKASLKKHGMTQKDLAVRSGLSESRISRILRGGKVKLTEHDIAQLAIGLYETEEGWEEMKRLTWPELEYVREALRNGESIVVLNCRLDEAGLSPLGCDYMN